MCSMQGRMQGSMQSAGQCSLTSTLVWPGLPFVVEEIVADPAQLTFLSSLLSLIAVPSRNQFVSSCIRLFSGLQHQTKDDVSHHVCGSIESFLPSLHLQAVRHLWLAPSNLHIHL